MDPFSIAALVAMIGGAAVQHQAASDAQQRQQEQIQRSIQNQTKLQREAESKALEAADKFAPEKRQAEQTQIADQVTQDLIAPVSESQAIRATQQATQGNVSDDYSTAKAKSNVESLKTAESLARLLGKTTSAGRLRMNEGIRLMDTGQQIGQLSNFSQGQQRADDIAIQQAGQVDPGQMLLGSILQSAGSAGMMSGSSFSPASKADLAFANGTSDPIAALNSAKGWTGGTPTLADSLRGKFNGMFTR